MRVLMIVHHRLWRAAYRSRIIAEGLARRGHQVTLMVTANREKLRFRDYDSNGVRIVETPDLTFGTLRSGWDPVGALRRHLWLKSQGSAYDVVHLFETRPATIFPGLAVRKRLGVPLVIDWIDWWGRGGIISVRRPWWYKLLFAGVETWFEERFRTCADATTVISYGLARRAIDLGVPEHTIHHIRNGSDLRTFKPRSIEEARDRLKLPRDKFLLGYAAQDTFFDMEPVLGGLKKIVDRGIDAELVLCGHAPKQLKKTVIEYGLEDEVRFLGYLDWEDYPYFQSACDALVVPFPDTVYNIGRWPGKFGEYIAAGRPVVFNPVGDLIDFTGPEAPGIACDFSADAFAEAFNTLYEDERLRAELGSMARRLACREMDWERSIDRFEGVYAGLVDRGGSGDRDGKRTSNPLKSEAKSMERGEHG